MAKADRITFSVRDDDNDEATFGIDVPTNLTLAQLQGFAQALAVLADDVIAGLLAGANIKREVDLSGLTSNTILSTSDVEDIGDFQFRTADQRPVSLRVPTIDEAFVNLNSDELDTTAPEIAAIITMMEDGIAVTGGTIIPTDVGELDIVELEYAREAFRGSGKRR